MIFYLFASWESVFTSANVTTHHASHLSDEHFVSEQLKGIEGDNRKNTNKKNYIDLFSHILNQNVKQQQQQKWKTQCPRKFNAENLKQNGWATKWSERIYECFNESLALDKIQRYL